MNIHSFAITHAGMADVNATTCKVHVYDHTSGNFEEYTVGYGDTVKNCYKRACGSIRLQNKGVGARTAFMVARVASNWQELPAGNVWREKFEAWKNS